MPLPASRVVVRRSQALLRRRPVTARNNSSTSQAQQKASEAAAKAKQAASTVTSRASEGLSRVTSSAGPAISSAAKGLGNVLGRVGGRTGRLIAFVESMVPRVVYYGRVGLEMGKIVFREQKMNPPSVQTFQHYFQPLINAAKHPGSLFSTASATAGSAQPASILNRVRNVSSQQLANGAVITAELVGFFTVGEIIGRRKIVGYRGSKPEHH